MAAVQRVALRNGVSYSRAVVILMQRGLDSLLSTGGIDLPAGEWAVPVDR